MLLCIHSTQVRSGIEWGNPVTACFDNVQHANEETLRDVGLGLISAFAIHIQLSGCQRQRVPCPCALHRQPRILL